MENPKFQMRKSTLFPDMHGMLLIAISLKAPSNIKELILWKSHKTNTKHFS